MQVSLPDGQKMRGEGLKVPFRQRLLNEQSANCDLILVRFPLFFVLQLNAPTVVKFWTTDGPGGQNDQRTEKMTVNIDDLDMMI